MSQLQRVPNNNFVLSLIFLLVATLIAIFIIVVTSVTSVNKEARITIENFVTATIQDKLEQNATLTKDYAYSDATIENAYFKQNKKWIDDNLGRYLTETFNISDVFIINSNDQLVLSLENGLASQENYKSLNPEALKNLFIKARQSDAIPQPVSGLMMINNTPALIGVSVLASDTGKPFPSPRPLLIKAIRLTPDFLLSLSQQYRLKNLHLSLNGKDLSDLCFIKIKNPTNTTISYLAWQTEKPGSLVLSKIKTPIVLLLSTILLILIFIIKSSRNTAVQLEQAYNDLNFNANHDPLTGLANRRLFNELLINTIHSVKRHKNMAALLSIDLDNFKYINDSLGHNAGDEALITVAKRLQASVRESDFVARIGGDEFDVLLQDIHSIEDIQNTAKKILNSISQHIEIKGHSVNTSVSIGIAVIPNDGTEPDALLTNADFALYGCKKDGKNNFRFYSE